MKRLLLPLGWFVLSVTLLGASPRPNIILVMADDMGWGQTGYYNHPALKTPNLDDMAAHGLRFDRFYAGAPVCSPTRASVMTGRTNDRTGVYTHGHALRRQEKTLPQALRLAGYRTGHFGKWHLNGVRGPGIPISADDPYGPGAFGFDTWISTTNFFDLDPLLGRQGEIEEFVGDSSEVVVDEAVEFLSRHRDDDSPLFAVIWFGSPHRPFVALPEDQAKFAHLDEVSAQHYGEMAAIDRSVGTLRRELRKLGISDNTLLVFCSDNGGLPGLMPNSVGPLRGFKKSLYEGGLRVPAVIEWPDRIQGGRNTAYPTNTSDLFPTIVDLLDLPRESMIAPQDGHSIAALFTADRARRTTPIPFRFEGDLALVDNQYKLIAPELNRDAVELYDLERDIAESVNLADEQPEVTQRLFDYLVAWNAQVEASIAGADYPSGRLDTPDPEPIRWNLEPDYAPFLKKWGDRPEYRSLDSDSSTPNTR